MTNSYTYNHNRQMSDSEIYQLQVEAEERKAYCCEMCREYDGSIVEGSKISGTMNDGETEFEGYLCDMHIDDNFNKGEYFFLGLGQ